jgi:hypothetical protein
MYCWKCGSDLRDEAAFCDKCGTQTIHTQAQTDQRAEDEDRYNRNNTSGRPYATQTKKSNAAGYVVGIVVMLVIAFFFGAQVINFFIPDGITSSNTYEISVYGSAVGHTGTVGGIGPDGQVSSESVGYSTSHIYTYEGKSVSVVFQKKDVDGELIVTVSRNGVEIESGRTSEAYGVVAIATR